MDGVRFEFVRQKFGPPVSVLLRHRDGGKDALRLPPLRRFHRRFVHWWARYARDVLGWKEHEDLTLTMEDARQAFRAVMQTWIAERGETIDDVQLERATHLLNAGGEPLDGEFADRGMAATLMWMKAQTQVVDLDIDAMESVIWAMPWPIEERLGYDESWKRLGFLDDELIAVQADELSTRRDYDSSRYRAQAYGELFEREIWSEVRAKAFAQVLREEIDDALLLPTAARLLRAVPLAWLPNEDGFFDRFLSDA